MWAVFKREYLQSVRKKMFMIMTFLLPFFIAGVMVLPAMLMARGVSGKHVVVIDGTGVLGEAAQSANGFAPTADAKEEMKKQVTGGGSRSGGMNTSMRVDYAKAPAGQTTKVFAQQYLTRLTAETGSKTEKLDGVMVIPETALDGQARLTYYSRSSTDFLTEARLSSAINRGIQRYRLGRRGIDAAALEQAMREVPVDSVQLTKTGEQKKGGEMNFIIGFIFSALLLMPSFVYGLEIMRGIIQEKTDRIVEVLVSSMTASQLLIGKILGLAAVGLTQIGVWIVMASIAAVFGAVAAATSGVDITQFINPGILASFLLFYVLAYLTYVCIYAIAGAACNTEKEAQQMMAPISMLMMAPWFLMVAIITNPESSLATGFSLSPLFGPLTMFVRILVSEPPVWQILTSIAVTVVTIFVLFQATAKIFRIGILSYGKRPTMAELWRWMKMA
jgi:ABC-2 type transport system permease protein